ncbi:MAG: type II toxin-antitoxin system prevent-host-death family antitoxin [SAR324 cluster bacterium]|nr:type II toxin-antitoxin system prevent-host-death family antitoxin [SAR324 cluster bacterium]
METVNIHQAKTHLSRLLVKVSEGEGIVIAKAGQPLARLVPLQKTRQSLLGICKGQIHFDEDDNFELDEVWKANQ